MSIETITYAIEFELSSGSWTNLTTYHVAGSLKGRRGVGEDRKFYPSVLEFELDNSGAEFTPGNTSSTYYNKIRKGVGVRFSTTHSATTRYHFRGVVTDIEYTFPDPAARAEMVASIRCEGVSSVLAEYQTYSFAAVEMGDVDAALTSVMTAVGSSLYSFEDSDYLIPFAFPRQNALVDLVSLAASEFGGLLWEDGQGRMRFKKASSMVGGYASPSHTWGSTIAPEGPITPDWRNESQYARQHVNVGVISESVVPIELYRHPEGGQSLTPLAIRPNEILRIDGEFNVSPVEVTKTFQQALTSFQDSGEDLGQDMTSSATVMVTSSINYTPSYFTAGDEILIDNEIVLVEEVLQPIPYGQRLTVSRGQRGTVAAAHFVALQDGQNLYWRNGGETLDTIFNATSGTMRLSSTMNNSQTIVSTNFGGGVSGSVSAGNFIKIEDEVMQIAVLGTGSNGMSVSQFSVTRGQLGTNPANHLSNSLIRLRTYTVLTDVTAASYVKGSTKAQGIPWDTSFLRGAALLTGGDHIHVNGRKFSAFIYNAAPAENAITVYLNELVIGGKGLDYTAAAAEIVYEKAIPGMIGVPDGGAIEIPYGTNDLMLARAFCMGTLRSRRVAAPWIRVKFTANVTENATSCLTADVGDLVRYTGTGTYREKIDEWYRITGIDFAVDEFGIMQFAFTLTPSHYWRDPARCWWTPFGRRKTTLFLPPTEIIGLSAATWNTPSQFQLATVTVSDPTYPSYAYADAFYTDAIACLDVGTADMVVASSLAEMTTGNTFAVDSGGCGVAFRSNSARTNYWQAVFNPTQSKVYLWNTTDGKVAEATWTAAATGEIEVRCQGDRIRVYIDCNSEPVIDTTSTRFNTQTYAGMRLKRTTTGSSGDTRPRWFDFYAQGI